jgi:hypothetical protein
MKKCAKDCDKCDLENKDYHKSFIKSFTLTVNKFWSILLEKIWRNTPDFIQNIIFKENAFSQLTTY